jgi:acyl-coenzyme A thioesterase PaaI-like protein
MSETAQIAQLMEAIGAEAARTAEKPVAIVSATFDWVAAPDPGEAVAARAEITRATRTIVFSRGDLRGADDRLLLSASAVHRVIAD